MPVVFVVSFAGWLAMRLVGLVFFVIYLSFALVVWTFQALAWLLGFRSPRHDKQTTRIRTARGPVAYRPRVIVK